MIVTVGSLNMDLVVRVPHHPVPGETILGHSYSTFEGGKGANQAVAAARAGGSVRMIGRVGRDAYGDRLVESLMAAGVESSVLRSDTPTGVAFIAVDEHGQNNIIVAPGANSELLAEDLGAELFAGASAVLLQLETPLPTVLEAARLGRTAGAHVVLNVAPAQLLSAEQLRDVTVLLVNELEAALLLGSSAEQVSREPGVAARQLTGLVDSVVITLGATGAVWAARDGSSGEQPAFKVSAVDTTGAGDCFAGSLAVALAGGSPLPEAVRFGAAAAALAVTRPGAQPGMPNRTEIVELLDGTEG